MRFQKLRAHAENPLTTLVASHANLIPRNRHSLHTSVKGTIPGLEPSSAMRKHHQAAHQRFEPLNIDTSLTYIPQPQSKPVEWIDGVQAMKSLNGAASPHHFEI
jgi:hypothetical protein